MKREIDVFDYTSHIIKQLKLGVLITAKASGKVNSMSIAWGTIGIEWNRPIFVAFVREGRYTRELLDENPEFTINIPYGEYNKDIIKVCGTKSGREVDKVDFLGLTLTESDMISVPGIKELPLTLECKVVHRQLQDKNTIPDSIKMSSYPSDVDSNFYGSNKDYHVAYYGEIVKAYILG